LKGSRKPANRLSSRAVAGRGARAGFEARQDAVAVVGKRHQAHAATGVSLESGRGSTPHRDVPWPSQAVAAAPASSAASNRRGLERDTSQSYRLVAALQLTAAALAAQRPAVTELFPASHRVRHRHRRRGRPGLRLPDDGLIERLRAAGGAEIAVVTLPTIEGYSEAEVALAIGREWGSVAAARWEIRGGTRASSCCWCPARRAVPGSGYLRVEVGQGSRAS
jgi:hypothetical protein